MKFLRQVFEARPHTRRTLGLSPLSTSGEKVEEAKMQERSQFMLFPAGTHSECLSLSNFLFFNLSLSPDDTTAQHGYWNRVGDFIAEVGKEWRAQNSGGQSRL